MKRKLLYSILALCILLVGCNSKPVNNEHPETSPKVEEKDDNVKPDSSTDIKEDGTEEDKDSEQQENDKKEESTDTKKEPTTDKQETTDTKKEPTIDKEESADNHKQPTENQKPTNTIEKPTENQKPADTTEKPTDSKEESTGSKEEDKKEEVQPLTSEQLSAKKIVDQIIKPSMSDFDKALAIHDWLAFNIDYDKSYSVYTVEDTLKKRVAVCEGYARTFKMMAELAGLEVNMITGTANGSHAWNQVKISGTWYNVDVTWDDPLFEGKTTSNHTANNYAYFLVSNATLNKDHTPNVSTNNAPTDYDRIKVLRAGLSNGYRKNHSLATNQNEANEVIKKYANMGYNEFYMWYYNPSVTQQNMRQEFTNLTKQTTYPITYPSAYPPKGGVTVYKVAFNVPLQEWNSIPVVHNASELANLCNAQYDAGKKEITVRYESADGSFEITGLKFGGNVSYTQYGITRLYKITPMSKELLGK